MKAALALLLVLGCSSSEADTPVVADAAVDTGTVVVDTAAVDANETSKCALTGACLEEFAAKQREADACFGHFGPGECGVMNGAMTTCTWMDGTTFDIVAVDGGDPTVVYKNSKGVECFRRLGNGDVVYPGGATFKTAIVGGKLEVSCAMGSFTCSSAQACVDCGIDLRVCCM